MPNGDNAKALSQFDRKEANLAILRTDARIPPRARAVAILEHDLLLLISPTGKKIKTIAELKKKKIAVIADGESGATLVRNILELSDTPDAGARVQMAPPGATFDQLFAAGFGAVVKIAHASQIVKDKSYEQYTRRGGFTLNAIDSAKAIARKYPAISEETVATGMLSASPAVPAEDVDTIGLEWLLVAQSKLSTTTVSDLARIIYENKAELSLTDGFASKIEPAATDKDAFIVAHPGAADLYQRRNQVLYRALQRFDVCRPGGTQHHRHDLCRHLHQDHPDRAGEGQPARDRHSRYRRAHGICQIAGRPRRTPGRTGNNPARRGDRVARRHHFQRRTGHLQARL
ncbi:TAXI family TRAP transporter solute-binding subunit [Bradyrhizobium sp. 190]|uniref:TAXI family TRAP transporter solute-binding subunit n=1 Tax=Bradyrhizobium sp. 190 TaxID=2782658 RepID=UPI001FF71140|nr:TAXI family TRAP transporter solute-binding subunit [Bradyrhizobium sp. 190]